MQKCVTEWFAEFGYLITSVPFVWRECAHIIHYKNSWWGDNNVLMQSPLFNFTQLISDVDDRRGNYHIQKRQNIMT